jgi:tetratricopeptide (TPR) repeat protein
MQHRFVAILILVLWSSLAFGQRPGGGGGTSGGGGRPGSTGSAGSPSTSRTTSNPNSFPNSNGTNPTGLSGARSIFLFGEVIFDDGTKASSDIRIERVCNGSPRLEGHTDSKGRFSFQLGQDLAVDPDASEEQTGNFGGMNGQRSSSSTGSSFGRNGGNGLWNCELRATYPGYRSDMVSLATRKSMDDPDVGTIVLHRLANVQGSTISVTTALAPKHAQKEYQKGLQLAQRGRSEEAEKHFIEATNAYAKYATAWYELGRVQEIEGKTENARKSYQAAISADGKYVSPYDHLALLSVREGKWEDAASFSKQVIQLNPVEFPSSYFYNALANYNLKRADEAEKSAKEVLKLDTGHKYPQAEGLLAQILMQKGDYAQAATHLRAYLTLVPDAKNADALKQQLQKLEQASAEAKK